MNQRDGIDLDLAEALWTLGLLSPFDMPDVAANALVQGHDVPELRLLAGLSKSETAEASALFARVLKSLGRGHLSRPEAAREYASRISANILGGKQEPFDGARAIWDAALRVENESFHDLDPFIYAASEYENRPKDRAFLDSEIRKEAGRWARP